MSAVVFELETVSAPTQGGRAPRLALHTVRRKQVQRALRSLKTIQRQDARESRRSEKLMYNPLLVSNYPDHPDDLALRRLITRLEFLLAAKL